MEGGVCEMSEGLGVSEAKECMWGVGHKYMWGERVE